MGRKRKGRPVHGWLVVDKPSGPTSTQVLGRVKRLFNAAKAGHAGTLDPIATGVLPIAFGEATKTVPFAMDGTKRYRFTVRWGESRDTEDCQGAVTGTSAMRPERAAILAVLPRFLGEIVQIPPAYSAIKIDGERAYDLAREGEQPDIPPRLVEIDTLELIDQPDGDHAVFEASCGKGTYMRALARDIAVALGTLGHLSALRRLEVGPFTLDDAVTLDHLEALAEEANADSVLLPVETPLDDIPAVALTDAEAQRLRNGQAVPLLRRSDWQRLEGLRAPLIEPAGRFGTPGFEEQGEEQGVDDVLVLAMVGAIPVALTRLDGAELQPVRILNL